MCLDGIMLGGRTAPYLGFIFSVHLATYWLMCVGLRWGTLSKLVVSPMLGSIGDISYMSAKLRWGNVTLRKSTRVLF